MGDDKNGEILTEAFNGLHHSLLSFVIQRTGGLIEDYNISFLVQSTRNTNTLTLATG